MPEIKPTTREMFLCEDGEGLFHTGWTDPGQVTTTGLATIASDPDPAVIAEKLEVYVDDMPDEVDEDGEEVDSLISKDKDGNIVIRNGVNKVRAKIKKTEAERKQLRNDMRDRKTARGKGRPDKEKRRDSR